MANITVDPNNMVEAGENILATTVGEKLVIVVDLTRNVGRSSTGKMLGVAKTSGFQSFPGNLRGNIYIGKK